MWQWKESAPGEVLPPAHGLFQRLIARVQVVQLRIAANQQGQFRPWHQGAQARVPKWCALGPRRHVATLAATRIAESHGDQGKAVEIVKGITVNTKPFAQSVSAGIIPGNAGGMDARAGRLAGNEHASLFVHADDGSRTQGQMLGAEGAGADLCGEQPQFSARLAWPVLIYHAGIMTTKKTASKPVVRCSWADRTPLEIIYHDREWGVPQRDDVALFEFLVLEGAQAGLSWSTILAKREGYRAAFDGYDVRKIARYTDAKLEKLRENPAIVRNKLKIESVRGNARAFIKVQEEFGSFSAYYWGFVDNKPIVNHFRTMKEVPPRTELSDRISKDLLKRGFKFVGSTIIYAYMQATGMVNDHLTSCDCYKGLSGKRT